MQVVFEQPMEISKLQSLAQQAGKLLKEKKATVSVMETATGGTISSSLLAVPGASSFFVGGINAYSLKAREKFLGWTAEDNANYAYVVVQSKVQTEILS